MKARVLIVDDSATVRADMRGVLSAAGFGTTLCDSLTSARKALREHDFELLILDMLLPDGDGVELLEELRRDARTANLPVLMLSTEAAVVQRLKGLSHGANDYVGKPYDSAYVVRRAHELTQVPESDGTPRLYKMHREVKRVIVAPRNGVPNLEMVVSDGTGTITAVFAGRRRIPGLDHGRTIVLEGVIVDHANRPVIYNPAYTLVP